MVEETRYQVKTENDGGYTASYTSFHQLPSIVQQHRTDCKGRLTVVVVPAVRVTCGDRLPDTQCWTDQLELQAAISEQFESDEEKRLREKEDRYPVDQLDEGFLRLMVLLDDLLTKAPQLVPDVDRIQLHFERELPSLESLPTAP